jgi:outer membrane protein assembly factor BamA
MRLLSRALTAALVVSASLTAAFPAHAQYSINKIDITGAAPYTVPEILSIAGLQSGQLLTHNSLANAAQHLLDTGVFDDVQISLSGQGKARTVLLELKPTPLAKLLPGSYANFVWWTPEELADAIHTHVPLYHGAFADAGNLPDLVQTALQQMLADKGVTAILSHTIVEPTTQHPQRVVSFTINQPSINIASINITGTPAALAPGLKQMVSALSGKSFQEGLTGSTIEQNLLLPEWNAGYAAAKLIDVQRTPAASAHGIGVTYTATLVAGDPYKVAAYTWSPTPIYSAADFAKDSKLHPGDLSSETLLQITEAKVLSAYRSQGYLDAYLMRSPTFDDAAHTVTYSLQAVPGNQYHLHTVTPQNLSPIAQQEFDKAWRMKAGDIYNEAYIGSFLNNNTAMQHLATYAASFQASADPQTHLVDLTITFVPGPR